MRYIPPSPLQETPTYTPEQSVKVWCLDTGKMVLDIKQFHSTWILAAKADYKRIVSTSQDSRTLVLDFSSGVNELEVLAPPSSP